MKNDTLLTNFMLTLRQNIDESPSIHIPIVQDNPKGMPTVRARSPLRSSMKKHSKAYKSKGRVSWPNLDDDKPKRSGNSRTAVKAVEVSVDWKRNITVRVVRKEGVSRANSDPIALSARESSRAKKSKGKVSRSLSDQEPQFCRRRSNKRGDNSMKKKGAFRSKSVYCYSPDQNQQIMKSDAIKNTVIESWVQLQAENSSKNNKSAFAYPPKLRIGLNSDSKGENVIQSNSDVLRRPSTRTRLPRDNCIAEPTDFPIRTWKRRPITICRQT